MPGPISPQRLQALVLQSELVPEEARRAATKARTRHQHAVPGGDGLVKGRRHARPLYSPLIPFPGGLINYFIIDAQCTSPHVVVGEL